MPVYAQYDREGTIVGVVEIDELPEGVLEPVLPGNEDHDVAELELGDEAEGLSAGEIINRYRVDPKSRKLVRRTT